MTATPWERRWRLAAPLLLAGSGFASLVFEVLWARSLANVVGSTAGAMSAVFAVFVLGMAAGAAAAARVRRRGAPALRLYGVLELAAGTWGFLSTVLLVRGAPELAALSGTLAAPLGGPGAALLVAALLVGPPAACMGAALPVLLNAFRHDPGRHVATLYACNVLGGAGGAAASGFVLVWRLGLTRSALVALLVDAVVAAAALLLARVPEAEAEPAVPEDGGGRPGPPVVPAFAALATASGFLALAYEVLWGRLAKLYLGDRTLAASALLCVYLAGLALGGLLVGPVARRLRARGASPVSLALWTMALGGAAHLLALGAVHAVLDDDATSAAVRLLVTVAAGLPPVVLLGIVFPLLLQAEPGLGGLPARAVGRLTFLNALGSAAGAVAGTHLLPPLVGTPRSFALCAAGSLVAAAAVELRARGRAALPLVAAASLMLGGAALAAPRSLVRHAKGEQLLQVHEDEYGLQVVTRTARGYLKVKNDRSFIAYHLGHPATSYTQQSAAYYACLLARDCGEVLNLGTGYGITAGAFAQVPGVREVVTVEVLPFVCRSQALFAAHNFRHHEDPRVRAVCGDGRHVLAASPRTWDVIAVNVLDPYVPGSASLYTPEFWRLARSRLRPGGVYVQLLWGPDLPALAGGLRRAFPAVGLLPTGYRDAVNAVALADPLPGPPPWRPERLSPAALSALRATGIPDPAAWLERALSDAFSPLSALKLADWARQREAGAHTDDRPVLEYRWSRAARYVSAFDSLQAFDHE